MSLFLHLNYANHKTEPIHTLAVTGNSVIIIVPVLLKTNDPIRRKQQLDVMDVFFREQFPRFGWI